MNILYLSSAFSTERFQFAFFGRPYSNVLECVRHMSRETLSMTFFGAPTFIFSMIATCVHIIEYMQTIQIQETIEDNLKTPSSKVEKGTHKFCPSPLPLK